MFYPSRKAIRLRPLEIGLLHIDEGMSRLSPKDAGEQELKVAITRIADGLGLLLMYLIWRVDWRLIFADKGRASPSNLAAGSFSPVHLEEAMQRFQGHCGGDLDGDEIVLLRALSRRRAHYSYYNVPINRKVAISLAMPAVLCALRLLDRHCPGLICGAVEAGCQVLKKRIDEFGPEYLACALPFVAIDGSFLRLVGHSEWPVVRCPLCLQLDLSVTKLRCGTCAIEFHRDSLLEAYNDIFAPDPDSSHEHRVKLLHRCPCCLEPALQAMTVIAPAMAGTGEEQWVCLSCSGTWEGDQIRFCDQCGHPFESSESQVSVCEACSGPDG